MRYFIDTNVWLYALIETREADRTRIAQEIVGKPDVVISVQVINELCVNLLRKARVPEDDIAGIIEDLYRTRHVVPTDMKILLSASTLRRQHGFSFWDSLIVAAALFSRAEILCSEDMQHGMVLDGRLRIVNPFLPAEPKEHLGNK